MKARLREIQRERRGEADRKCFTCAHASAGTWKSQGTRRVPAARRARHRMATRVRRKPLIGPALNPLKHAAGRLRWIGDGPTNDGSPFRNAAWAAPSRPPGARPRAGCTAARSSSAGWTDPSTPDDGEDVDPSIRDMERVRRGSEACVSGRTPRTRWSRWTASSRRRRGRRRGSKSSSRRRGARQST